MEYASKGLAGTALGFGIGGAAMSLANGGLGNLLGGLGQNNRAAAAEVTAAAATPAMAALAAALASRQQEPTCSENMPVTRYDLDREQKLSARKRLTRSRWRPSAAAAVTTPLSPTSTRPFIQSRSPTSPRAPRPRRRLSTTRSSAAATNKQTGRQSPPHP